MAKIRSTFNTRGIEESLRELAELGSPRNAGQVLEQGARVAAVSLARSTQPYGDGDTARHQGENAVARDYKKAVARVGDAFVAIKEVDKDLANAFWKAVTGRKWARAQEILNKSGCRLAGVPIVAEVDDSKRQMLRRNGRVKSGPTQIARTTRLQNRGIKQAQRDTGKGKGGWASCARILGNTRGIPAWVTRHAQGRGAVIRNYNKGRSSITLRNNVKYSNQILRPSEKARAMRIATERMRAHLNISIEKLKAKRRR
jgi:hypothetical protein